MRSILRSYAFRGLIGFGLCGLTIGLPLVLFNLVSDEAPALPQVARFIVSVLLFVLGPAIAAALLVDDERGWRRLDTALVFSASLLLVSVLTLLLLFLWIFSAIDALEGNLSNGAPQIVTLGGVVFGAGCGASLGWCSLFLKRHMRIARARGASVWFSGFVALLLSASAVWPVLTLQSAPESDPESRLLGAVFYLLTFALGGLLFGLILDYIRKTTAPRPSADAATRPERVRPTRVALVRFWCARGLLAAPIAVVLVGGSMVVGLMALDMSAWKHERLGMELKGAGRMAQAITEFQAAVHDSPRDIELRGILAEAYRESGRYDDAAREYKAEIRQGYGSERFKLAQMFVDIKRYDDAERQYREILKKDPKNGEALVLLGEVLTLEGKTTEADKRFEDARTFYPSDVFIRQILAKAYQNLGRNDDAIRERVEAIKIHPNSVLLRFDLARLYDVLKRYDDAARAYREAIRCDAKNKYKSERAAEAQKRLDEISKMKKTP